VKKTLLTNYVSPGKGYYSAVFRYVDVKSKSVPDRTEINAGIYIQPPASQLNCTRIWLNCRDTLNSKLSLESYFKTKASQAHNMLVILLKPRWQKSGPFYVVPEITSAFSVTWQIGNSETDKIFTEVYLQAVFHTCTCADVTFIAFCFLCAKAKCRKYVLKCFNFDTLRLRDHTSICLVCIILIW
jgi:hypothetical protein